MILKPDLVLASAFGVLGLTVGVSAETILLKSRAQITGEILARKPDAVVVDLGYTVLVIPRDQVSEILSDGGSTNEAASVRSGRRSESRRVVSRTVPVQSGGLTNAGPTTKASEAGFYRISNSSVRSGSVRELAQKLGEAVVQVRTPRGLGSGFIINEDGYLITNYHVVEGETEIEVEVYHQRGDQLERKTYKQIRIVALNKAEDLALLKIEDKGAPRFVWVPLGASEDLAVGERVFAIGSPLGLERTVTEGIISTKTRLIEGRLYLQTTAQINPGNSGGPLFNLAGEVVGVTNMKITYGEGLGFAIPSEFVKYFLDHRDAYAYSNDNPSNPYRYLDPPRRAHTVVGRVEDAN